MRTGVWSRRRRIWSSRVSPSASGRPRSSTTAAYCTVRNEASASATVWAASTSRPARANAFVMRATRSSLSSTTNSRICPKTPLPLAGQVGGTGASRLRSGTCNRPVYSAAMKQLRIPAVYMRGGTSKGVFFLADDLPSDPAARDRILLRVIGSPDRYGKHTDGMGGATSSTSKVVIISRSERPGCDVDYRFGQVAIDAPVIDWSGNCGNLSAAVGPFALSLGLVEGPADGTATVNIWQANIGKKIVNHVPMQGGEVQELGGL